jgi:hypothetical protein
MSLCCWVVEAEVGGEARGITETTKGRLRGALAANIKIMKFAEGSGNRSGEQAMSGAARRLVLFWEKWTDGGVAGQSFGCFGTMKEFGDAETENEMGSLPPSATDGGRTAQAPHHSSQQRIFA